MKIIFIILLVISSLRSMDHFKKDYIKLTNMDRKEFCDMVINSAVRNTYKKKHRRSKSKCMPHLGRMLSRMWHEAHDYLRE